MRHQADAAWHTRYERSGRQSQLAWCISESLGGMVSLSSNTNFSTWLALFPQSGPASVLVVYLLLPLAMGRRENLSPCPPNPPVRCREIHGRQPMVAGSMRLSLPSNSTNRLLYGSLFHYRLSMRVHPTLFACILCMDRRYPSKMFSSPSQTPDDHLLDRSTGRVGRCVESLEHY